MEMKEIRYKFSKVFLFRNKSAQMKLEKLDNDLKNYKSNSIKANFRDNIK